MLKYEIKSQKCFKLPEQLQEILDEHKAKINTIKILMFVCSYFQFNTDEFVLSKQSDLGKPLNKLNTFDTPKATQLSPYKYGTLSNLNW